MPFVLVVWSEMNFMQVSNGNLLAHDNNLGDLLVLARYLFHDSEKALLKEYSKSRFETPATERYQVAQFRGAIVLTRASYKLMRNWSMARKTK